MHYLGIDPGKNGGFCLINQDGFIKHLAPMPIDGAGVPSSYEIARRYRELRELVGPSPCQVFIEKVQAMPHDGKVGLCSYWQAAGRLEMVALWGWPVTLVPWRTWATPLHQGLAQDLPTKVKSELVVKRIWPSQYELFFHSTRAKKPHDGMLEAALIAHWGRLYSPTKIDLKVKDIASLPG